MLFWEGGWLCIVLLLIVSRLVTYIIQNKQKDLFMVETALSNQNFFSGENCGKKDACPCPLSDLEVKIMDLENFDLALVVMLAEGINDCLLTCSGIHI